MNAIDLKGRTAIVTGGARGIGFAAAQKMLASGAAVALWDIDAAALGKAAASLAKSGRVYTAILDLTAEAEIGKAVEALIRDAGRSIFWSTMPASPAATRRCGRSSPTSGAASSKSISSRHTSSAARWCRI